MNLKQLDKLSKNPNYKLSDEEVEMLEEYRATNYRTNNLFKKHNTNIKKEKHGKSN